MGGMAEMTEPVYCKDCAFKKEFTNAATGAYGKELFCKEYECFVFEYDEACEDFERKGEGE